MANIIVYSFVGSQWAGVAHLALAEKGFVKGKDYEQKEIDLGAADNFAPEYLKINPNGTVPSLTAASLPAPITDSVDILRYLNKQRPDTGVDLIPADAATRARGQQVIDLVHSAQVDTNVLFFAARSAAELDAKKQTWHKGFIDARQARLEKEHAADPGHAFYGPKRAENGMLHREYATPAGTASEAFYADNEKLHRDFAAGMAKLEDLLALPYAAGDALSEADFNAVPWLSHAMVAAGSDVDKVQDFSTLDAALGKSVPGFAVGPRTRQWWKTVAQEKAFQQVFPRLN